MTQPPSGELRAGCSQDSPSPRLNGRSPLGRAIGPDYAIGNFVGIVANRGSGNGSSIRLVERLVRELVRVGIRAEIAWTPEERQALVAATAHDSRYRCLVAVGGDGTVSALINDGPKVPITVLPAGTENLTAQHFGLRRNPAWLAAIIAEGLVARIDLGSAAGRRFMLMTGFGFDGDIVSRHHSSRTSRSGRAKPTHRAAYVEPILRSSLFYRFPSISVEVLDTGAREILHGTTVFVFNLPRYALGLPFAPDASQDDGLLDLVVFRDPGPFQALYYLWRVFCGTHLHHPGVYHRRIRRVHVRSAESVPVQLDGDPAGSLAPPESVRPDIGSDCHGLDKGWRIEVLPEAIELIVPASHHCLPTALPLASTRVVR
jgi:diacylglycerol kinase family enzyme